MSKNSFPYRCLLSVVRETLLRGCKRVEVEAKVFSFNTLTASTLFGLVLQRYKHSKCHFNVLSRFVPFCPVLSCFVLFCPVFVCNWLRLRCCFADERVLSHELWVGYRLASQTTSPQDHETTSGSRPTSCLVVLAQPSKKLRRLVSTSVRHHSSIPLKYSPLGGIRGDTVVRRGWQCRILGLCSATASQTTRPQDYKWLPPSFADYETTRLRDYKWLLPH